MENMRKIARENGFEIGTIAGTFMASIWVWQIFMNSSRPDEIIHQSPKLLAHFDSLLCALFIAALIGTMFISLFPDLTTKFEDIATKIDDYIFVVFEIVLLFAPLVMVHSHGMTRMVIIPCYYIAFSTSLVTLLQKDEKWRNNKQSQITSDDDGVLSQQSEELVEQSAVHDIGRNVINQGLGQNEDKTDECDEEDDHTDNEGTESRRSDEFEKLLRVNEEIWDYMMTTITSEVTEECEKNLCKFTSRIEEENKELLKMKEEKWEEELREITRNLAKSYDEKLQESEEKWSKHVTEVGNRYAEENTKILKMNDERWEQVLAMMARKSSEQEDRQQWEQNLVAIIQQHHMDRQEWEKERRHLMAQIEGWNILADPVN